MKYLEYFTVAFLVLRGMTTPFAVDRATLQSGCKGCAIKTSRRAVAKGYRHYDSWSFVGLGS